MMRRKLPLWTSCFGMLLLEQAAVVFAGTLFILAIFDGVRFFQVYGALSEAAQAMGVALNASQGQAVELAAARNTRTYTWYQLQYRNGGYIRHRVAVDVSEGEVPETCRGGGGVGGVCQRQISTWGEPGEAIGRIPNIEKAWEEVGKPELQAVLPRVRFNCGEDHCASLAKLPKVGDSIAYKLSYKLPFLVLGKKTVDVEFFFRGSDATNQIDPKPILYFEQFHSDID